MKAGVQAKDVYQHAVDYIREKKPDFEKYFVKNLGFAVRTFFGPERQKTHC